MKTREWLLVIFVVILVQFIIQSAASLYGGNTTALGYISFTGTVVSIILAVLAIVYSFTQSVTQQNSSNTISRQVEKLIDVTDRVDASKVDLGSSLDKLYAVSGVIESTLNEQKNIRTAVKALDEKVDSLGGSLLSYMLNEGGKKSTSSKSQSSVTLEEGHNGLIISSLFLYYGHKHELSLDDTTEKLVQKTIDAHWAGKDEDKQKVKNFMEGHLFGTFQSFCAFGLITETESGFKMDKVFLHAVSEYLEYLEVNGEADDMVKDVADYLNEFQP